MGVRVEVGACIVVDEEDRVKLIKMMGCDKLNKLFKTALGFGYPGISD